MSNTMIALISVAALIAVIALALARGQMKRNTGGYQRRFNGTPIKGAQDHGPRHDDGAFPFASTLYLGDGGGSGNHHSHSSDCGHHSDPGGSCSDGGGGGGGSD